MANTFNFGNKKWATKEGSVLAYNSENNNFKPLPFDFTRSSSATRVNKDGLIEVVGSNKPRVDYLNNADGHLLLEPSRTNEVINSSFYPNTYWGTQSSTITLSSNSSAPNGDSEVAKLTIDATGTFRGLRKTGPSAWNSKTITLSTFVKYINSDYIFFYTINAVGGTNGVWFKISDGTIGTTQGAWSNVKIEDYGNGWYRCSANVTFNALGTSYFYILNADNDANQNSTVGNEMYIYGAQVEEGSYATSYIPTSGSAVTRAADNCNNGANEQVINSAEGVLYFEGSSIANDGTFKRVSIGTSDNLFENSIQLRYNTANNSIQYQFRVGNVYQADLNITANTTNVNKIACVWKINRFEIWVNGVKEAEDTLGSVPSSNTFKSLFFGKSSIALAEPFNGNIKEIKLYNTALTDAELIALTTL
jgi:hypothetical protein